MRTFFSDLVQQLKGIWGRLDGGQRLVVTSVLLATVVGLGAMVWFAGRPSYEVVYNASSGEDIATVQKALDGKVPYIIGDGGMTFLVDRSRVGIANAAIREAGLLSENSSTGLGASSIIDDAETKAWKLANASIARAENAVRQLEGVAAVHITASAPKKTRAFVDRDRDNRPMATVLLKLRPGTSFEISARTAASLTASQLGIPLENVTVSNAAGGGRWSHDPDREAGGGSSEFLNLQRNIGRNRTAKAQDLLDQMWPNKTSVAVNVELDPNWEVISEKVLPSQEIIRSEKTTKETSDQQSGVDGSRNSALAGVDPQTKNETKNETTDREYVTEIGERRSGKMAPEIKRLTVAVLYDRSLEDSANFNKDELTNAVKAMVGWDKDRDPVDGFSVMPGEFAPVDLSQLMTSKSTITDLALQWGPTIGQVLGVIVVVFFLRGLFKRSTKGASASVGSIPDPGVPQKELSPEENQARMRREIERAIASDPAALAKLLETWLIEQTA